MAEVLKTAHNTGQSANEYVNDLLSHHDSRIVIAASAVTWLINNISAEQQLVTLLDHPDSNVCAQAVITLGRMHYNEPAMLLTRLRPDAASWRLSSAIKAAGNVRSVKVLLHMLEQPAYADYAEVIIKTLRKTGSMDALAAIANWHYRH
jgi:hypothetical protein